MPRNILLVLQISIAYLLLGIGSRAEQVDSNEQADQENQDSRSVNKHIKGDTSTTSSRYTSARAFMDENRKRDGYRYYGTGSKSGNSFLPTNIHKSTSSLDSHNYFVTAKSNLKDMDAAGSGMSSAGAAEGNNYLTVYESPAMMNSAGGGSSMLGIDDQFGDMAAETGHGGGGYGHSGGGGGGGKGCNSALGLLGVLGLAAYLQNVLRNMQNGTAGRRRRDISYDVSLADQVRAGMAHLDLDEASQDLNLNEETHKQVLTDVFPLLSAVSFAVDGLIPIHCTHSSVCLTNRVLVKDLGNLGHSIGIRISSAIAKLLTRITKDEKAEQIRMISKAGKMGRNGRNCLKVFPTCNRLRKLPTYNIPSIVENQRNHQTS